MRIREYSVFGQFELVKNFKERMKAPLIAWFVRLWGMWVNRISLCAVAVEKPSDKTFLHS